MHIWTRNNLKKSPNDQYPYRVFFGVDGYYQDENELVRYWAIKKARQEQKRQNKPYDKRCAYMLSKKVISWLDDGGYEYKLKNRMTKNLKYHGVITLCFKNEEDAIHFKLTWL